MAPFIVIALFIIGLLFFALSRTPRRDGLAPEGGPRIKNLLAYLMVRSGAKRRPEWQSADLCEARVPVPEGVEKDQYNDSFVFQGADASGNVLLTRLGFRDGGRNAEIWFWVALDGQRYDNPEQFLILPRDSDPRAVVAGGLEYCRQDDGSWRIRYSGLLGGQDAQVDLTWKADSALYCSADHMDSMGTAKAMAEMPWSREYFERIQSEKQVRIEQGGVLEGILDIGGTRHELSMRGIRDHSWGKRDWTFLNRYIWNVMALEDDLIVQGRRIRYFAVSPVDYGDSFKRVVTGWMSGPDGVIPVAYATDLSNLGGDGEIPGRFEMSLQVPGGRPLKLTMDRRQPEMPWLVADGGFEINEAYCACELEGVKGFGLSEFGYAAGRGFHRPFEKGPASE